MRDWENMRDFSIEIILHSLQHRTGFSDIEDEIVNQRITILHLDHATELLMKAFLSKKKHSIYRISRKNQNISLKINEKLKNILDEKETLSFPRILDKVCELVNFDQDDRRIIMEFHRLRNEIQHRALNIGLNKEEKIEEFTPVLYGLYKKMFPRNVNKIEGMLIEP